MFNDLFLERVQGVLACSYGSNRVDRNLSPGKEKDGPSKMEKKDQGGSITRGRQNGRRGLLPSSGLSWAHMPCRKRGMSHGPGRPARQDAELAG